MSSIGAISILRGSTGSRSRRHSSSRARKKTSYSNVATLIPWTRAQECSQVEKLTDEELAKEVETTDVFARLSPAHKKRVVQRSEEHTSELQSPCNLVCR